eukprot:4320474-Amphidinium_carterae.1
MPQKQALLKVQQEGRDKLAAAIVEVEKAAAQATIQLRKQSCIMSHHGWSVACLRRWMKWRQVQVWLGMADKPDTAKEEKGSALKRFLLSRLRTFKGSSVHSQSKFMQTSSGRDFNTSSYIVQNQGVSAFAS